MAISAIHLESSNSIAVQQQTVTPVLKPKKNISNVNTTNFNAFTHNTKTNLIFKNVELVSVLKFIAEEGNKTVICDKSVKGTISLNLKNVTLNQAMQKVLSDNNLTATVNKNTINVKKIVAASQYAKKNISANNIAPVANIKPKTPILPANNIVSTKQIQQTVKIQPSIDANLSMSNFVRSYSASYQKTFNSTLSALTDTNVEILKINSSDGIIIGRVTGWKSINITVKQINPGNTSVKITPTDGIYNISTSQTKEIFDNLLKELSYKE